MNKLLSVLLVLFFACAATAAEAVSCGVTATSVAFGNYVSPGGAVVDSTGTVSVTCTPDRVLLVCSASYTIALSAGNSVLGFAPRRMSGSGFTLDYNLYTNGARTTVWGDGSGVTSTVPETITSSILGLICLPGIKNSTVFGRVPANQNVGVATYSDSIVVTVTF